jgi:hypothetical protein
MAFDSLSCVEGCCVINGQWWVAAQTFPDSSSSTALVLGQG